MNKLEIKMIGKLDSKQNEYYFSTTHVPVLLDLSNSVIHFFFDEDEPGSEKFSGRLVIRHYDGKREVRKDEKDEHDPSTNID